MKLIPIAAFSVAVAAQSAFAEDLPPSCQRMVNFFSACSAEVNQAIRAMGTDTSNGGWPSGSAVSKQVHAALSKNGGQKQEALCERGLVDFDKNLANVAMVMGLSGRQLSDACAMQMTSLAATADSLAEKVEKEDAAAQVNPAPAGNAVTPVNASSPTPGTADFQCNTAKHTVIVDHLSAGQYRYRAWNKPKPASDTPDMQVQSGSAETSGTGQCQHTDYTFKNGKVVFTVSDDIHCGESAPPANASGFLSVEINGVEKARYWCEK
ncbi:hypothetical protein [Paraburkholderia sp. MM6662-R1]|uniref:hypothetical protein n=1 Tax=Paraburkholderia sp. MM6662-R1 TaxID=2991066 RepID=UPI003D1FDB10